jgi:hypothetical protein
MPSIAVVEKQYLKVQQDLVRGCVFSQVSERTTWEGPYLRVSGSSPSSSPPPYADLDHLPSPDSLSGFATSYRIDVVFLSNTSWPGKLVAVVVR